MTEDLKEFDKLIKEKKISDVQLRERHEKVVIARGNVLEASIKVEITFDGLITKTGGEDLVMNPEKKEFHLITGVKKEDELGGLSFKSKVNIIRKIMKKVDDETSYTQYLQSKEWEKKNKEFIEHFKKCGKCGGIEQLYAHHISYENFGNEKIEDVEVLCWYCGLGRKQEPIELLNQPEPPLLKDLEKFVSLRNIFAHVPVSWFAKELEFDENSHYNHFFKLNEKWRNISYALKEFIKQHVT